MPMAPKVPDTAQAMWGPALVGTAQGMSLTVLPSGSTSPVQYWIPERAWETLS